MDQLIEFRLLLLNGLLIFAALACFQLFRNWVRSVHDRYEIYILRSKAEKDCEEIRTKKSWISDYELANAKKNIELFKDAGTIRANFDSLYERIKELKLENERDRAAFEAYKKFRE